MGDPSKLIQEKTTSDIAYLQYKYFIHNVCILIIFIEKKSKIDETIFPGKVAIKFCYYNIFFYSCSNNGNSNFHFVNSSRIIMNDIK